VRDKQKGGIFPSQKKKMDRVIDVPARDAVNAAISPLNQKYYAGDLDVAYKLIDPEVSRKDKKGTK
jgi:hypothetical protein